jgi:hypothetical protein
MKFKIISIFVILSFPLFIFASGIDVDSIISVFQDRQDLDIDVLTIPTVVELPLNDNYFNSGTFAVYNETTNSFEPYYIRNTMFNNLVSVTSEKSSDYMVVDNNLSTYKEFDVSGDNIETATIVLKSDSPITSDSLTIMLDRNVALPNNIKIIALVDGKEKIIYNTEKLYGYKVNFPQTTSKKWIISFEYIQPLRITELVLNQKGTETNSKGLRFLAQPGNDYIVYSEPDRYINIPVGELGDLSSNDGVLVLESVASFSNPAYVLSDVDSDGIPDMTDNCINIFNDKQEDLNNNGKGDVCEDYDKDGVINSIDNCENIPNRNQLDSDSDGLGDACDNEESRFTEKYAFIPWLGILFAILTVIILFALTYRKNK